MTTGQNRNITGNCPIPGGLRIRLLCPSWASIAPPVELTIPPGHWLHDGQTNRTQRRNLHAMYRQIKPRSGRSVSRMLELARFVETLPHRPWPPGPPTKPPQDIETMPALSFTAGIGYEEYYRCKRCCAVVSARLCRKPCCRGCRKAKHERGGTVSGLGGLAWQLSGGGEESLYALAEYLEISRDEAEDMDMIRADGPGGAARALRLAADGLHSIDAWRLITEHRRNIAGRNAEYRVLTLPMKPLQVTEPNRNIAGRVSRTGH